MSDIGGVSFNEEPELVVHHVEPPKRSSFSLIGLIMKLGIASTEQGASTTLACFAVVLIIAAAGTYLWSTVPHPNPATVAAENEHIQELQGRANP